MHGVVGHVHITHVIAAQVDEIAVRLWREHPRVLFLPFRVGFVPRLRQVCIEIAAAVDRIKSKLGQLIIHFIYQVIKPESVVERVRLR